MFSLPRAGAVVATLCLWGGCSATEATDDTGGDRVTGPIATEPVYLHSSDTLFSYDPVTRNATRIGAFTLDTGGYVGAMTDIAIDLQGRMFGGADEVLYRIDPATGGLTTVMTVGDAMTGLTFVSDGRLVGAGWTVFFIDVDRGEVTTLSDGTGYRTSGDIVGLPDGQLYWVVEGGDTLLRLDPVSGDATVLGNIGVSQVWGIGYASGELLGFTSGGEVVSIDPETGRGTERTPVAGGSWYGATTNPVLW